MENQLEEQLSKVLAKSLELAEKTGNFVINQAPELLQEFYSWHIISSIFFIFLSISILIIGRYTPIIWLSKQEHYNDYKYFGRYGNEGALTAYALFFASSFIGIIMFFENVYYLVFILVAPKIYLIEYFIK